MLAQLLQSKSLKKPLPYIIFACLIGWVILIASSFFIPQGAMKISVLAAKIEFGVHFFTFLVLVQIFLKVSRENRPAIIWLLVIGFLLFLADLLFYIAAYANNSFLIQLSFVYFLFYYAPCIIYCFVMITFLSKIFLKDVMHRRGFLKIVGVLAFINALTFFLFLSSVHYAFGIISWQTISQMALLSAEFIVFDFAILGLIYAANTSVILLLSGTILLVTGDFFLTYSSISQTVAIFSYGELLWLLGLLFDFFAMISIQQNKHYFVDTWFGKTNLIKNRLAFWAFSISISGFLLFFVFAYIFNLVSKQVFVGLPLFIMIYSVIIVILSILMGKTFEAPFKKIENNIETLKQSSDKTKLDDNFSTEEFIFLQKFITDAFEYKEAKDRAKKELGELTAQVAHDIRSPLSALDMLTKGLGDRATEQERIMMRTAFRRINNIANDLVAKYKGREYSPDTTLFIYVVLKDIVSEKDLEYEHKAFRFELQLDDPASAFLLMKGNYKEMRRLFSNLINNAVNAMPKGGVIQVRCERREGQVCIRIRDQGCGLSQERITQLLSEDQAAQAGIGLGLKHAKEYVKQHEGKLSMESTLNVGTEIILAFPILPKPKWLAEKLEIDLQQPIMIIDDDSSIHELWTKKLEDFDVKREDFYTTAEAYQVLQEGKLKPDLILCDYEFVGQKEVGLDFLKKVQDIPAHKYLVTTHVDNEEILDRLEALNLQVIPKHLLPYVCIEIKDASVQLKAPQAKSPEEATELDAVFIDDDLYNHEFWQFAAKQKKKKLRCFTSLEEFEEKLLDQLAFDIPIYIDLNIKNVSGLTVAKKLHERGFTKLYITTGYINFDPKDYPYLAGVIDKTPPF